MSTDVRPRQKRRPIAITWESPQNEDVLRDTGIPLLGRMPWGSHVCMFVDTPRDLIEAVIPYFRAGLANNECCIWVVTPPFTEEAARDALKAAFSDYKKLEQRHALQIVRGEEWYLRNNRIDVEHIVKLWLSRVALARARGFSGIRATANSLWQRLDLWRDFQTYEHTVETRLADLPVLLLCTYSFAWSGVSDVLDIAASHQCVIARRDHAWEFLELKQNQKAHKELTILNADMEPLSRHPEFSARLTTREKVILGQLVKGNSTKVIARKLGISPRTVDFHRANLLEKLEAKNTADLVRIVMSKS